MMKTERAELWNPTPLADTRDGRVPPQIWAEGPPPVCRGGCFHMQPRGHWRGLERRQSRHPSCLCPWRPAPPRPRRCPPSLRPRRCRWRPRRRRRGPAAPSRHAATWSAARTGRASRRGPHRARLPRHLGRRRYQLELPLSAFRARPATGHSISQPQLPAVVRQRRTRCVRWSPRSKGGATVKGLRRRTWLRIPLWAASCCTQGTAAPHAAGQLAVPAVQLRERSGVGKWMKSMRQL
mmetsp:Transcript_77197/g.213449  ORF Transcript_77197/g.213449 Transcript_77197/m.213449 type:complete len:237 (-) Transcript_77197:221-931(-)